MQPLRTSPFTTGSLFLIFVSGQNVDDLADIAVGQLLLRPVFAQHEVLASTRRRAVQDAVPLHDLQVAAVFAEDAVFAGIPRPTSQIREQFLVPHDSLDANPPPRLHPEERKQQQGQREGHLPEVPRDVELRELRLLLRLRHGPPSLLIETSEPYPVLCVLSYRLTLTRTGKCVGSTQCIPKKNHSRLYPLNIKDL